MTRHRTASEADAESGGTWLDGAGGVGRPTGGGLAHKAGHMKDMRSNST
jgi:hypothetical protein